MKWEHMQLQSILDGDWRVVGGKVRYPDLLEALNTLGQEGWEWFRDGSLEHHPLTNRLHRECRAGKHRHAGTLPPTCRDCGVIALVSIQCVDGVRCYPCAMKRGYLAVEEVK